MRGLVISLSGPDGSGKSTLIGRLKQIFEKAGREPVVLWTRLGYTPGFEAAKAFLRRGFSRIVPQRGDQTGRDRVMKREGVSTLWLVVACIDLLFTYCVRIRVMTRGGQVVICDRYVWDALIDQAMFFPGQSWAGRMIRHVYGLFGRMPEGALLLSLPFESACKRSEAKLEPFPDSVEIRLARHRLYEQLAQGDVLHVLDATVSPEALADEVMALLRDR
jgi:thymidylate kinase